MTNLDRLVYAFGHLVSSHSVDAHAAASGELADDEMKEMGLTDSERHIVEVLAEHVAGNYGYTGEAEQARRDIERGAL